MRIEGGRKRRWSLGLLAIAEVVLKAGALRAQLPVTLGSEQEHYYRFLELEGQLAHAPLVFRSPSRLRLVAARGGLWAPYPGSVADSAAGGAARVDAIWPTLNWVFNSRYPGGVNDGALWAGRGFSGALTGGVEVRWGLVKGTLAPTLWYAQNRGFDTVAVVGSRSSFTYPWSSGIDWPQRFGAGTVTALDWGQSDLRLDASWFTAGLSTENQWWGPAFRNPILMSNTAAGFPHVDLGVGRPTWVGVGRIEARVLWGRLAESDYFDSDSTNNTRLFAGFVLGFQPRWAPGLVLGAARVFYQTWTDSLRAADFVDVFQTVFKRHFVSPTNPTGEDIRDQLLSLSIRWLLPASEFEAYLEWARNDHSADLRDFVLEPDHSEGWVVGFQKALPSGDGRVRLRAEVIHLGQPTTFQVRNAGTFYHHSIVEQGYTHRGQLLGAGVGPGSNSQFLGFDRYHAAGRWGFYFQRGRYNDDSYYALFGSTRTRLGHEVELTVGGSAVRLVRQLELSVHAAVNRELNRHYQIRNDVTNFRLEFGVRWLGRR